MGHQGQGGQHAGRAQADFATVLGRGEHRVRGKGIDEGLLDYGYASAHQPGAPHAVWSFLTGYLFADDVTRIYRLPEPADLDGSWRSG